MKRRFGETLIFLFFLCFHKSSADENALADANQEFAIDFYKKLASENPGKNIFLSPISISIAYGMVNLGTRRETQSQMKNVLHLNKLNSDNSINEGFKQIITKLNDPNNNYTLHLANRLFGSDKFQIKDKFLQDAETYFGAPLETLNFIQKPEESRSHINTWVERETKEKIKDLLPSGIIDQSTVLVLVNAIYLKAGWFHQFDKTMTKPAPFHISKDEQVLMDQMYLDDQIFNYYDSEELKCEVLELPYLDNKVSMFVFLPREIDGLTKLEEQLTAESLTKSVQMSRSKRFEVKFPKFQMDQDISLKQLLQSLGMVDLFQQGKCDLSGIADDGRLVVSDAVHKTFISVDEVGTEAAAATGVVIGLRSSPKKFTVDRPFLFLIFEKNTKSILFLGRVVRPPKSNESIGSFGERAALTSSSSSALIGSSIVSFIVVAVKMFTIILSLQSM